MSEAETLRRELLEGLTSLKSTLEGLMNTVQPPVEVKAEAEKAELSHLLDRKFQEQRKALAQQRVEFFEMRDEDLLGVALLCLLCFGVIVFVAFSDFRAMVHRLFLTHRCQCVSEDRLRQIVHEVVHPPEVGGE